MPKKLKFEKTYQDAVCKVYKNKYTVISFWDNDNKKQWLKYYQVQKNRKKIANYQNLEVAIRRMMSEANYELQDLFSPNRIPGAEGTFQNRQDAIYDEGALKNLRIEDFNDGETIRFIDHKPHYYKRKKIDYYTTIDFAGGQYYLLKEFKK